MPSPARWVGTEAGFAPYPCWSTDDEPSSNGAGKPDGSAFIPAETDFTLQNSDNWFYSASAGVHPARELRLMWETSVGHNTPVIIDFAPFPNGSLPFEQKMASVTLGKFISGCYERALAAETFFGAAGSAASIDLNKTVAIDRVYLSEDMRATRQQLVRGFTLMATLPNGTAVDLLPLGGIAAGSSIGAKFILILATPLLVTKVTLGITTIADGATGPPAIVFRLYSCAALAAALDTEWDAFGFQPPPKSPAKGREVNALALHRHR